MMATFRKTKKNAHFTICYLDSINFVREGSLKPHSFSKPVSKQCSFGGRKKAEEGGGTYIGGEERKAGMSQHGDHLYMSSV